MSASACRSSAASNRRRNAGSAASALLTSCSAWLRAQGVDCVELWVEGNNREANRLYATSGFVVNKTVVDYRHFLPVRRDPA